MPNKKAVHFFKAFCEEELLTIALRICCFAGLLFKFNELTSFTRNDFECLLELNSSVISDLILKDSKGLLKTSDVSVHL